MKRQLCLEQTQMSIYLMCFDIWRERSRPTRGQSMSDRNNFSMPCVNEVILGWVNLHTKA